MMMKIIAEFALSLYLVTSLNLTHGARSGVTHAIIRSNEPSFETGTCNVNNNDEWYLKYHSPTTL